VKGSELRKFELREGEKEFVVGEKEFVVGEKEFVKGNQNKQGTTRKQQTNKT